MTDIGTPSLPTTWTVLARALQERRPVRARYHGAERTLCPHALGSKNGRAKVLVYQAAGTTSHGPLTSDTSQRWRSMFVDEVEAADIIDVPWETAANYSLDTNCFDSLDIAVPAH